MDPITLEDGTPVEIDPSLIEIDPEDVPCAKESEIPSGYKSKTPMTNKFNICGTRF